MQSDVLKDNKEVTGSDKPSPDADSPERYSVQESIIQEKMPDADHRAAYGPTNDLFFHELAHSEVTSRRVFDVIVGTVGSIIYFVLFPFLWIMVRLSKRGSVFTREECPGYRGMHFKRRVFNVYDWPSEPTRVGEAVIHLPEPYGIGKFLQATRLDRLPLFPLVVSGKMSLVGPHTYPVEETTEMNMTYTQFYKRYAVKPGIISPSKYHNSLYPPTEAEYQLKMIEDDLRYVKSPSVGKDLKILFGF